MRLILSGALGQMGRAVAVQARAAQHEIVFGVDSSTGETDFPLFSTFAEAPTVQDAVLIDFSRPELLPGLLAYATAQRLPAVLATTGYSVAQEALARQAAAEIPIFRAANMSLGVAVLARLCQQAAEDLGPGFDVEIVEAHHRRKADAPSGTAWMLYEAVAAVQKPAAKPQLDRHGMQCLRTEGEIGLHALRGGTAAGEHAVCFFGPGERLVLRHSAEDRSIFAAGALRAAAFLTQAEPGLYDMQAIL